MKKPQLSTILSIGSLGLSLLSAIVGSWQQSMEIDEAVSRKLNELVESAENEEIPED